MGIAALKEAAEKVLAAGWDEVSAINAFDALATPETILSLIERVGALEAALKRIEAWQMPETGKFWTNPDGSASDRPMSYAAAYGSNGERDHIRSIARAALSPTNQAHPRGAAV